MRRNAEGFKTPIRTNLALPPPLGGGGTDFAPFFAAIEATHEPGVAGLAIYLTDGLGPFPRSAPALPTLWVLTPGGIDLDGVPFGEAVRLLSEIPV